MKPLRQFILSTDNKGVSLAGALTGSVICSMLTVMAMQIFIFGNSQLESTHTQVALQGEARSLTMQLFRTANDGAAAVASNGGDRLEITDADGLTSRFDLVGNEIVFTSNINGGPNPRTFRGNIIKYAGAQLFELERGNLIRMRLRFQDTDGLDGPQWVDVDVKAKMRNVL